MMGCLSRDSFIHQAKKVADEERLRQGQREVWRWSQEDCCLVLGPVLRWMAVTYGETNLKNGTINNGPSHTNTAAAVDYKEQLDIDEENNCSLFQFGVDIKPNQDPALLSGPCNSIESATEWTFYVEYSEVYTVPTLFFEATSLDGALLGWNALKPHFSCSIDNGLPWKCVTPEVRCNGTPCFQLHPCSTKSWMKMLLKEEELSEGANTYLSLWLRLVSNAFAPTSHGRIHPACTYLL
eukprot:73367_1